MDPHTAPNKRLDKRVRVEATSEAIAALMQSDPAKVKVMGYDDRGKVKLSMRVVDQASGEDITEKVGAKPGRGDRDRDRGERRERRDQVEAVPPELAEQPVVGE